MKEIKNTVDSIMFHDIPKITDVRGNLAVIEKDTIPYEINHFY